VTLRLAFSRYRWAIPNRQHVLDSAAAGPGAVPGLCRVCHRGRCLQLVARDGGTGGSGADAVIYIGLRIFHPKVAACCEGYFIFMNLLFLNFLWSSFFMSPTNCSAYSLATARPVDFATNSKEVISFSRPQLAHTTKLPAGGRKPSQGRANSLDRQKLQRSFIVFLSSFITASFQSMNPPVHQE